MGLGSHNCILLDQGAIKSDWHGSSCNIGGTAHAVDEALPTILHSSLFSLSTDVSIRLTAFLACNNPGGHTQISNRLRSGKHGSPHYELVIQNVSPPHLPDMHGVFVVV